LKQGNRKHQILSSVPPPGELGET